MKKTALLLFLVVLLILVSCASSRKTDDPYDVGLNLAERFLSTPVLTNFQSANGRVPVAVIGLVSSSADADYSQISSGFKNKLVASGSIDLIIGSTERDSIREERIEQLNWGNMEQAKSLANEMVADYFGRIFITPYGQGYIISADIVEVETGRVVWSDQYGKTISLPELSSPSQTQQKTETAKAETKTETKTEEKKSEEIKPVTVPEVQEVKKVSLENEKDEFGHYIIAYLPNDVTLMSTETGNMFFQYQMKNTDRDYSHDGYGLWPAYINTYTIDLTDPIWERYKDKKVRIFQGFKEYAQDSGSQTGNSIKVQPNQRGGAEGLYDLEGLDSITITSELRTAAVDAADLRFETHLLLPATVKEGSSAAKITELPSAFLFEGDFSPEKSYVISLRGVPLGPLGNLVTAIVGGSETYVDKLNGKPYEEKGYIMSLKKNGSKYDVDMLLSGIIEDFILTFSDSAFSNLQYKDYGNISIRENTDTTWVNDNCVDLSSLPNGAVTLTTDKEWSFIWALPEDDDSTYHVTITADAICLSQKWNGYNQAGGGVGSPTTEDFFISSGENTYGYVTVFTASREKTITYKVEKVN